MAEISRQKSAGLKTFFHSETFYSFKKQKAVSECLLRRFIAKVVCNETIHSRFLCPLFST